MSHVKTQILAHLRAGWPVAIAGDGYYRLSNRGTGREFLGLPVEPARSADYTFAQILWIGGAHGACFRCDNLRCRCERD